MNLLVRFLRELRPYTNVMIGIALVTLANSILSLQAPSLVRVLFNALDPRDPGTVLPMLISSCRIRHRKEYGMPAGESSIDG